MRKRLRSHWALVLALVLAAPALTWADEEPAAAAPSGPSDEDCLSCHTDPNTTRADNKPVIVDAAKWKASIHGEVSVSCIDCHADLAGAELPHAEKLKPAQCGSCHEKAVPQFEKGIHAKPRTDGKGPNATCDSCHGKAHEILASGDRRSPTHLMNQVTTCAKCHDDPKLISGNVVPGGVVPGYVDSIHGRGMTKAGLNVAPTCTSCHGAHDVRTKEDVKSPTYGINQSAMCGKCHEGISEKYDTSIHGVKVKEQHGKPRRPQDPEPPTCTSCHSAHKIQRADVPAWELGVTNECGTCHEESLTSYRDNFHGSVTELGFSRMAKCADCHGAHDIVDKKDPRSRVVGENLLATCRTCHENAGPGFVEYDPHADPHDKDRSAILYYVSLAMQIILAGVMGTFGLHTLLWLVRSLIERSRARRKAAKGGK
jgi:hypothetical protein